MTGNGTYAEVPIAKLTSNPFNPRRTFDPSEDDEPKIRDMANSILRDGMIQPVVVRRTRGGYEVAAGERRLRAGKLAGLSKVPVIVREMDDETMRRYGLIENLHRLNLGSEEREAAIGRLWEKDYRFGSDGKEGDFSRGARAMSTDLGIPRSSLIRFITSYRTKAEGRIPYIRDLKPPDAMRIATISKSSPKAAGILAEARSKGGLTQQALHDAVAVVKRATTPEKKVIMAESIADAARRREQTVRLTEKEVAAEIENAKKYVGEGKVRTQLQILVRGDQALLNRVITFAEQCEKMDIVFLETFGHPKTRDQAVERLRAAHAALGRTLAAAVEPDRIERWRREWAETLDEAAGKQAVPA